MTKLSPEELSDLQREYAAPVQGDIHRLFQHISAMESEHRALLADNAALKDWVDENGHRIGDRLCPYTGGYACQPGCAAYPVHSTPHPGAALLSELHDLRARVEMMGRASWYADFQQEQAKRLAAERERDEARAQAATARASALEEAARAIECGCDLEECKQNAGPQRIRALATTPPPQTCTTCRTRPLAALDIADGITTCVTCANRADGDEP